MVCYFNEHQKASPRLEAIYLIVEECEELPRKVVYHRRYPSMPDHTVKSFEEYMKYLQTGIRIEIHSLVD